MLGTFSGEYGLVIDSFGVDGTRPSTGAMGTAITPGNNAYGSYTSVLAGASLTDDAYLLVINANNFFVSAAAHDTLLTIGLDATGGTSFTDWITDLVVGPAGSAFSSSGGAGGVQYVFPLSVKAGTSVGVKASQNNASPQAGSVMIRFYCQPSKPDTLRVGSRVVTYGSSTATSAGTAVTPGALSEGTYTLLGTVAAGDAPWFWQMGVGLNNAAVPSNNMGFADLALGSSTTVNRQAIQNQWFSVSTIESIFCVSPGGYEQGAPGDNVYGRMQQGPNGATTGISMAAYGVI